MKRLKAIDPGYAPAEVKQALRDYISATEQGIDALKARQDNRQIDDAMAKARDRLVESLKKWDLAMNGQRVMVYIRDRLVESLKKWD